MKTFLVCSVVLTVAFAASLNAIPKESIQGRIFGGNVAETNQFPYQVGLFFSSVPEIYLGAGVPETAWCGGALISREFVLTAGHCTYGAYNVSVRFGAHNSQNPDSDRQNVIVGKDNIFSHPQYDPEHTANDIALIRLPVPVELNDAVQPIKLPRPSMVQSQLEGHMVVTTGWGQIGDYGSVVNDLRFANGRILPQKTCAVTFPNQFDDSQVCVSGNVPSVCPGDSGGPLVAQEDDGTDVVVGVASFIRIEGCEKGFPTVFSRVTYFLDWITKTTGIEVRH